MTTVLLVDDVDLFLDLEKSFLEDSGYTVVTARSGEEALACLAEVQPAVVLLDLFMPGIDGDEVCRRLRAEERWRGLPVIMITAAGKEEEIGKCLAAGCNDYLTKPINKKELLEKVKRLLGAPKGKEIPDQLARERLAEPVLSPSEGRWEAGPEKRLVELAEENRRLHQRIAELEEENRRFAEQVIHTEEVNNNLTNLYIASSRLHSVLDRAEVMAIINEVVINFVGAEKFALLLYDEEAGQLQFGAGEGFDPAEFPVIPSTSGFWQELVIRNDSYFQGETAAAGSDDPHRPLAAIPLRTHDRLMGVLAVYRLFIQKEEFASIDYQLFSMMAEHAATALFSSGLYQKSERKRETYRGFMELLLK